LYLYSAMSFYDLVLS